MIINTSIFKVKTYKTIEINIENIVEIFLAIIPKRIMDKIQNPESIFFEN